jgi:hypothetical protein
MEHVVRMAMKENNWLKSWVISGHAYTHLVQKFLSSPVPP